MNYQYLISHKELFPSAVGITHSQFEKILIKFSRGLRQLEQLQAARPNRLRTYGGGRKPTLKSDEEKLLFIMLYYKVYPTFRLAQLLFSLDKRNCQLWKQRLEKVFASSLDYQLKLPAVRVRFLSQVITICPGLRDCLVDATERPINRPKDPTNQEHYYSGKKKHHTVKNQIVVNPRNHRIMAVSLTVEGKRHDKKLLEDDGILLRAPPKSTIVADSGYQGSNEINPLLKFIIPKKKPPNGELSETDIKANRTISSIRVRVEHPFSYLKHFNILAHQFRGRLNQAHQPFVNLACVYNFTRKNY